MRKTISSNAEAGVLTVGALISELCRWPDHAVITFRCPTENQGLRFISIHSPAKGAIDIEFERSHVSAFLAAK